MKVNMMKQTVIILSNNWLFKLHRVFEHNHIDFHKVKSIHAEYSKQKNETVIILTTE